MATLRDQILQQWGYTGDWNQDGIDRADELAQILAARGITDLGQLNFREQEWTPQSQISVGESGDVSYDTGHPMKGLVAFNGDTRLGYLGDFNNDGTVKTFADSAEDPGWRGDHMAAAWSARGDGNVSFVPTKLGNGQIVMRPVWGSSRKETYDDIRGAAMVAAAALGGYYAGGGNAAAGLSGVDAAMVDLAASGGLTPASMGSAGLGAASGGMSGAELASFMEANAGAGAPMAGMPGSAWYDAVTPYLGSGAGDLAYTAGNALNGVSSGLSSVGSGGSSTLGSAASSLVNGAKDVMGTTGVNWGGLLGAAAGAIGSKDQTQTTNRDPWSAAQPFLKELLGQGSQLNAKYAQQPFSQAQQTAYGNMGSLLDAINANAGGLLGAFNANASGANQFVRGQPQRLQGGGMSMNGFNPGLLGYMGSR